MSKSVFITGGTGFIGSALAAALTKRGDRAIVLSRSGARAEKKLEGVKVEIVEGDPTCAGSWQERLAGVDAVVNLAGHPIGAKRWDTRQKQLIHDSRVDATRYVVEGIGALDPAERPAVLVSGSGIDYYALDEEAVELPDEEVDEVDETAPAGDTFMARLCLDWEREAATASRHGVRVARSRTGLVLGRGGGMLPRVAKAFKWFVGGRLGSGAQWMSWIHIDDAVGGILHVIDREVSGPFNLVAPHPVRNRELSAALGKALGRPSFIPAPRFAIAAIAGELAQYILNGRRAVPRVLQQAGYQFRHPTIEQALAAIYDSNRSGH